MDIREQRRNSGSSARGAYFLSIIVCLGLLGGCYAPLRSPGIKAQDLPECYRVPTRTAGPPLNFASLTARQPADYLLGPGDVLQVTIPDLYEGAVTQPLEAEVMSSGEIHLPQVGALHVGGMNVLEAQQAITAAYAAGFLNQPQVNVTLGQPALVDVLVLGEVQQPGVHPLPKYQNDVGHALAAAGGLNENAAYELEVHRRTQRNLSEPLLLRQGLDFYEEENSDDPKKILRIPFRGLPPGALTEADVILNAGDVVVVPSRKHEVFFVVGRLSPSNLVRFSLGNRERELGSGLVLPRDREIDVVTAVTMAGYIDPIESPTTVTVHRTRPDGTPMLIHVDLIEARYDKRATVLIEPGDIIYLNPDSSWYFRHLFERIIDDVILFPYAKMVGRPN